MQFQRIPNSSGIDDLKLIGETDDEKTFIRQLAECGTLSSTTSSASSSVVFRAISLAYSGESETSMISVAKVGKLDFTIRQNANFLIDLTFSSATLPIDLSTYTAIKLQVKTAKSSGAIVTLSLGEGLTISGDDSNVLSIAFTPAMTKLLTNNQYYYDLMMSEVGINKYFVEGKINVNRTVTQ